MSVFERFSAFFSVFEPSWAFLRVLARSCAFLGVPGCSYAFLSVPVRFSFVRSFVHSFVRSFHDSIRVVHEPSVIFHHLSSNRTFINAASTIWDGGQTGGSWEREKCKKN